MSLENALALATARLGKVDDAISMLEPDAPLDTPLTQTDTTLLYLDTGPGFARVGADKGGSGSSRKDPGDRAQVASCVEQSRAAGVRSGVARGSVACQGRLRPQCGESTLAATYGWILFKAGNTDGALHVMKFAADGAPADGGIQYRYATVLVSPGNTREAAAALQRALSARDSPDCAAAKPLLGDLKR